MMDRYESVAWIGLTYSQDTGSWGWLDETPLDYNAFGSDWLLNLDGTEECAVMLDEVDYRWEESHCSRYRRGFCKQPAFLSPKMHNCPQNINVNSDANSNEAHVTWTDPTATSDAGGSVSSLVRSHQSGDAFPIGVTTVTISASNDVGTSSCRFSIRVRDNEHPVYTNCPSNDVVIDIPTGQATYTYNSPNPTATDNDAIRSNTCTGEACQGDVLAPGTYQMHYVADDTTRCNGKGHCRYNLIIRDVEPPTITCGADIVQNTDSDQNDAIVTWSDPETTDNVGVANVVCTPASGDQVTIGATDVECTVSDAAGNTDTCSFTVTVEDNQQPSIIYCPVIVTNSLEPNNPWAVAEWNPEFEDNSDHFSITSSHTSGQQFPLGQTTVVVTATDAAENSATCTFSVEINDNTPPVFTNCPTSITVNAPLGEAFAVVSWPLLVATDNSQDPPIFNETSTEGSFGIGNTRLAFSATDGSDNTGLCVFSITVIDDERPLFTFCPPDVYISTEVGLPSASANWIEPVAEDNSGLAPTIYQTRASGERFWIGTETVTYVATDTSYNNNTCAFIVVVNDDEPPQISNCSDNIEESAPDTSNFAIVTWLPPDITDNSGSTPTVTANFQPDITPPVFVNCPSDMMTNSDPNEATTIVTWDLLNSTDNSGLIPTISDPDLTSIELRIGIHQIVFTAEDTFGNIDFCQFNVTVIDNEPPVFLNCPNNRTVSTDHRMSTATVNWDELVITDNSGDPITVHHSHLTGHGFPIGYHTVNITAVDSSWNSVTCIFNVLIEDSEAPVFHNCPTDIFLETLHRSSFNNGYWDDVEITDNSGLTSNVTTNYESGDVFYLGQSHVVYSATDAASNMENCSFTVVVLDTENPYFTFCPPDISINTENGVNTAVVNWNSPNASDNSQIEPVITSDYNSGDIFQMHITTVTYKARDDAGNIGICQFEVDVIDNEPPYFINMTGDIEIFIDATKTNTSVEWKEPLAADNSLIEPTISSTRTSGDIFSIGVTRVVYTAVDQLGNERSFTFSVNIRVAFANLESLINGTSEGDILHISAIASNLANTRPLSTEEIEQLASVLTVMASEDVVSDREVEEITEDVVAVTNAVLNNNKEIKKQVDIIIATEKLIQKVVITEMNTSFVRPSGKVVSNIGPIDAFKWSCHFREEEGVLSSTRDSSTEKESSDKCFVKLDPKSAKDITESATIIATYYDRKVIAETTSETFDIDSSDGDIDVAYTLASGLLSYSISSNSTTYSVGVEFSMELDQTLIHSDVTYFKENARCVFWEEIKRVWSTTGCKRTGSSGNHVKCKCEHTTTFGIFTPVDKPEQNDEFDFARLGERLGIYSVCLISMIALLYIMKFINSTWGLFRGPETVFIYSNLLLATLCVMVAFVVNSETVDYPLVCSIFGVLLHFFYMATLLWLIYESIYLFMRAHRYSITGSIPKRSAYFTFAWGGAAVIAAIFFGIQQGYDENEGCWLKFETGGLVAFVFPSMTLIFVRIILLTVLTACKIEGGKRADEIKSHVRHSVQCSVFLVPQLILTWAFIVLAEKEYIYWLLFYILFSLNGLSIAAYCYFTKEITDVRNEMKFVPVIREERRVSVIQIEYETTSSQAELSRYVEDISVCEPEKYEESPVDLAVETIPSDNENYHQDELINQSEPAPEKSDIDTDLSSSSSSSSSEDEDHDDDEEEDNDDNDNNCDDDDDDKEEENTQSEESEDENGSNVDSEDDCDSDDNMFR
ncbi:hyalin-like isoform X2 [Anneissia japonica]|uniref:hyalin-like isoform X2 n=1 Tax=Anneissia japonica TaxID=1529436 RepID=UPI00142598C4|nr:hyalin-like isoform X2 [Anneissia japonica]